MALFDWLRPRSPLQAAIKAGLAPGGDLARALNDLDDAHVRSRGDGEAVCAALQSEAERTATTEPGGHRSALSALISLFQSVPDTKCPGVHVLAEEGLPLLVRIVADGLERPDSRRPEDLLFAMKVFAMYGSDEGIALIVRAARVPLAPDNYMWSPILRAFTHDHPNTQAVFAALATPLPPDFIAVCLLDAANAALLENPSIAHPFDSDAGIARLRAWLTNTRPDEESCGVNATVALPLLSHPQRDAVLSLAMGHTSVAIRLEAAWAAGKLGREDGVRRLAALALDLNSSSQACHYLEEIGRSDAIPPAAREPSFQARAQFASWLAHPNELNQAPDEVNVVDHRVLPWPPEFKPTPLWLLAYLARDHSGLKPDDTDVGLVGGVTFCLFGSKLGHRPPEDGYGIHCCWELEGQNQVRIDQVRAVDGEYDAVLGDWVRRNLHSPKVLAVAEVEPAVGLKNRIVVAGSATRDGSPGWFASDGAQYHWYPASDQPADESATTILKIHIGRQILGLGWEADRKPWLRPEPTIPPDQIIIAYEKLIARLDRATGAEVPALFGWSSALVLHFDDYLDALVQRRSIERRAALVDLYDRCLTTARRSANPPWPNITDEGGFFIQHFKAYIDGLSATNRSEELGRLVLDLEPVWNHNLGYGLLGHAAYLTGDLDKAERLLVKLHSGLEEWQRSESLPILAEIWIKRGDPSRARDLLVEAMQRLVKDHGEAMGGDIRLQAGWFHAQRKAFVRLFPSDEAALTKAGIPASLPEN